MGSIQDLHLALAGVHPDDEHAGTRLDGEGGFPVIGLIQDSLIAGGHRLLEAIGFTPFESHPDGLAGGGGQQGYLAWPGVVQFPMCRLEVPDAAGAQRNKENAG